MRTLFQRGLLLACLIVPVAARSEVRSAVADMDSAVRRNASAADDTASVTCLMLASSFLRSCSVSGLVSRGGGIS